MSKKFAASYLSEFFAVILFLVVMSNLLNESMEYEGPSLIDSNSTWSHGRGVESVVLVKSRPSPATFGLTGGA
jgi:hypothetical protein